MKRLWLVILLLLILAVPAAAQAADPTPMPAPQENQARAGSPILGILVLAAPFLFLLWKSRGKKDAPRVTSGACMPVMDQERSPEPPPDENT
jgi:hypothetical protein